MRSFKTSLAVSDFEVEECKQKSDMNSVEVTWGGGWGVAGSGSEDVVGSGWVRGFEGECFLGGYSREREVEFEPMCGDSEFLFSCCNGLWWLSVMVGGRRNSKFYIPPTFAAKPL